MKDAEIAALVKRFFDAAESGDLATIAEIYADDFVIWHNDDDRTKSKADNLVALEGAFARLPTRRYSERKVNVFPDGFVQQHRFVATRTDGGIVEMPAVVVGTVKDGHITRIDEYFETAALGRLRAPTST